jgi:hypothetical protein
MMLEKNVITPGKRFEMPQAAARREIITARQLAQAEPLTIETIDEIDRALCTALSHLDELERMMTPRVA